MPAKGKKKTAKSREIDRRANAMMSDGMPPSSAWPIAKTSVKRNPKPARKPAKKGKR